MHSYTRYDGFVVMSVNDNVAVALEEMHPGREVKINGSSIKISDNIEFGHKFAIREVHRGENIIKYGEIIGVAAEDIGAGRHVHVHNVKSLRGDINH